MKNHSQDDFNKFVKSTLEDNAPAENGWNVAPQFVFDNAMNELDEKRNKKNRSFVFFTLFLLGGFLATSLIFYTSRYIDSVESKVDSLEQTIAEYEDDGSIKSQKIESSNEIIEAAKQDLDIVNAKSEAIIEKQTLSTSLNTKQKSLNTQTISREAIVENSTNKINVVQDFNLSVPFKSKVQNTIKKKSIISPIQGKSLIKLESIQAIAFDDFYYLRNVDLNQEISTIDKEDLPSISKWSLSLLATQNHTCMSMENVSADPNMTLTEYDKRYAGVGLALNLNYSLNSFLDFNLIGSFSSYNSESLFNHRANYDLSKEMQHTDGSSSYDAEVYIMTPIGAYSTTANFGVEANQHTSSDIVVNETSIQQSLMVLTSGIGLTGYLPLNEKINFFASSAILSNHIINTKNQFATKMSMDDKEMASLEMNPSKEDMTSMSNQYFSWNISAGLEYNLNSKFSLSLSTNRNNSFTNIHHLNNTNLPNTYIHNVGINFGTKIKF